VHAQRLRTRDVALRREQVWQLRDARAHRALWLLIHAETPKKPNPAPALFLLFRLRVPFLLGVCFLWFINKPKKTKNKIKKKEPRKKTT
jgi:hypothetical protein